MSDDVKADVPEFLAVWQRYRAETFGKGAQAELRRVADPDELRERPALYRLFPGERPGRQHLRVAFLLPHCSHKAGAESLGTLFAKSKKSVAEARVLQMVRSPWPEDIKHLRRLIIQVDPAVDWGEFGQVLWFWNDQQKRRIVEDYYIAQFNPAKGAKK